MKRLENALYLEDIEYVAKLNLPWKQLKDKTVAITGASGQIGCFFIDVLMYKNRHDELGCTVVAMGRNEERMRSTFDYCCDSSDFVFMPYDISLPLTNAVDRKIDFFLHLASNTHPVQYSTDPIGTITTNIVGLLNVLNFAADNGVTRVAFASSNEIYGENRGDTEKFDEGYCGYIDCNTLRAGYPESKRCGEALCQAFIKQKGLDVVIPRITRTYGPTLLKTDSKALSQFLNKGVNGEDIVLKSKGTQFYSYLYVADTVSGLLTVLLKGQNGEAYNIADERSDITLKELAAFIANASNKKVVFEIPDEVEQAGFSKATKALLDSSKLQALGWTSKYNISEGIARTLAMLKKIG